MSRMIYADHAATTRLDPDALESMLPYLQGNFANPSQPYSFSRSTRKALVTARETIAACIGAADPQEILFTSGGTESVNWAIKGMPQYNSKNCVITSQIEHHAVLNSCATIERCGFPMVYLPVTHDGTIMPQELEKSITNDTRLVSIMLVNNEIGTIEPIAQLAQIAHGYGAFFHTDAVQAVGHIPVNVSALDVDMLSASAHKFNGPRGVGFLYIKGGTPIRSFMDGGAQEYGRRAGTENVAGAIGMAVALKKSCQTLRSNREKLLRLEEELLSALHSFGIDFIRNGGHNHVPGNVSVSFRGASGEMLLHRLDLKGIFVSTGSACDSKQTQISHVIQAIKVPEEYAEGTIRISFGKENEIGDGVEIARAIREILGK